MVDGGRLPSSVWRELDRFNRCHNDVSSADQENSRAHRQHIEFCRDSVHSDISGVLCVQIRRRSVHRCTEVAYMDAWSMIWHRCCLLWLWLGPATSMCLIFKSRIPDDSVWLSQCCDLTPVLAMRCHAVNTAICNLAILQPLHNQFYRGSSRGPALLQGVMACHPFWTATACVRTQETRMVYVCREANNLTIIIVCAGVLWAQVVVHVRLCWLNLADL